MRRTLLGLCCVTLLGTGCRPRIEPVSVAPRVEAEPGAGVRACWVESRATMGFTASSVVIRHPEGTLLIDAGNSSNFDEEIDVYEGSDKRWLATFPRALAPKTPLGELLASVDVDPTTLKAVVPTHAHLDHLGGVLDLPPTPVWVPSEEIELIAQGRERVTFEVIPAHAHAVADQLEPIAFADAPYEIFDRHADLFGDGSVVVVPMPGHTPGSVGVFIRLDDGRRVFHVGDAVNDRVQIEKLRGRTRAMRRTDHDRPAADRIVARLHGLVAQDPSLLILPAHERGAWKAVFDAPTASCSAAP